MRILFAILFVLLSVGNVFAQADVYVDDGGSNTSPYETWAKAAPALLTAIDYASAGDTIYVGSDTTDQLIATTVFDGAGTVAAPIRIISADITSGEPPTTFETMTAGGGNIDGKTGGGYDVDFGGYNVWTGLKFTAGDNLQASGTGANIFYDCDFVIDDSFEIGLAGSAMNDYVEFNNCTYTQITSGSFVMSGGALVWRGSTFSFDGGTTTSLFNINSSRPSKVQVCDVDFQLAVDDYLADANNHGVHHVVDFKRCKVPAWSGGGLLVDAIGIEGTIIKFHSVSNSDIIYQFQENYATGQINEDTGIYLDATYDGTNGYSAKMVTLANAIEWQRPLRFKLAELWNPTANATVTVEMVLDSATALNNDDVWIEIEYPNGTTGALGDIDRTSRAATILTTPSARTSSSVSWTGTGGFGNEQKIKIAETLASDQAGVLTIWVCLAKPSTTIYVDPKVDLS